MNALPRVKPADVPVVQVRSAYGYEARKALILNFRSAAARISDESPIRLSIERLHKLMGEYVAGQDFLVSLDGMTPREENLADLICYKTLGKVLTCAIDIRIDRMQAKIFRFLDAFVALDAQTPMQLD